MSKLRIVPSQKFNRDVKLAIKRGYNIQLLDDVVEMIAEQQLLPLEYKDYKLIGNYSGCRECHIVKCNMVTTCARTWYTNSQS